MYIINIEMSFEHFFVIFFEETQMLSNHIREDVSVEIKITYNDLSNFESHCSCIN
jgi:hypothetical protein